MTFIIADRKRRKLSFRRSARRAQKHSQDRGQNSFPMKHFPEVLAVPH
jgi:hypothetical protein